MNAMFLRCGPIALTNGSSLKIAAFAKMSSFVLLSILTSNGEYRAMYLSMIIMNSSNSAFPSAADDDVLRVATKFFPATKKSIDCRSAHTFWAAMLLGSLDEARRWYHCRCVLAYVSCTQVRQTRAPQHIPVVRGRIVERTCVSDKA